MEDNNMITTFIGPEVCFLEGPIGKENLEKFLACYDRLLSLENSGIRLYINNSLYGDLDYVRTIIDLINLNPHNIYIVFSGEISGETLYLFMYSLATVSCLPGSFLIIKNSIDFRHLHHPTRDFGTNTNSCGITRNRMGCDLPFESKYFDDFISFLDLNEEEKEGIYREDETIYVGISHPKFLELITKKEVLLPKERDVDNYGLTEEELINLNGRVIDMGFLEDDNDLSDKEFISAVKDSLYGKYSKEELEEFRTVLMKRELYHRIKLIDDLIKKTK